MRNSKGYTAGEAPILASTLSDRLFVHCNICEPRVTGDVQAPLLCTVSVDTRDYCFGTAQVSNLLPPNYIPVLHTGFLTIEIDIGSQYTKYYALQAGGGGGIPQIYTGARYQKDHGIGSFLECLFQRVLPFLNRGVWVVGKEALRAGINVLDANIPLRNSFKNRFGETGESLKWRALDKFENIINVYDYKNIRKKWMVYSVSNRRALKAVSRNPINKRKNKASNKIKNRGTVKRKKATKNKRQEKITKNVFEA